MLKFSVIRTLFSVLAEAPIYLRSFGETKMFEEGKLPKSSDLVTDVAVLGMFHEHSSPSKSEKV